MEEDRNKPVKVQSPPAPPPVVYDRGAEDENEDDLNRRSEMPFLDHLEELRRRILWSLGYIFVGIVIGFFLRA